MRYKCFSKSFEFWFVNLSSWSIERFKALGEDLSARILLNATSMVTAMISPAPKSSAVEGFTPKTNASAINAYTILSWPIRLTKAGLAD